MFDQMFFVFFFTYTGFYYFAIKPILTKIKNEYLV